MFVNMLYYKLSSSFSFFRLFVFWSSSSRDNDGGNADQFISGDAFDLFNSSKHDARNLQSLVNLMCIKGNNPYDTHWGASVTAKKKWIFKCLV